MGTFLLTTASLYGNYSNNIIIEKTMKAFGFLLYMIPILMVLFHLFVSGPALRRKANKKRLTMIEERSKSDAKVRLAREEMKDFYSVPNRKNILTVLKSSVAYKNFIAVIKKFYFDNHRYSYGWGKVSDIRKDNIHYNYEVDLQLVEQYEILPPDEFGNQIVKIKIPDAQAKRSIELLAERFKLQFGLTKVLVDNTHSDMVEFTLIKNAP